MKKHFSRFGKGGLITLVGFILSPFSWWNDLIVNIPIAYGCAWLVGKVVSGFFLPAFVVAYWGTNVLGMVLLQKGGQKILKGNDPIYNRRAFIKDLIITGIYTVILSGLIQMGILKQDFLPKNPFF
jgi:hypothetical protein